LSSTPIKNIGGSPETIQTQPMAIKLARPSAFLVIANTTCSGYFRHKFHQLSLSAA